MKEIEEKMEEVFIASQEVQDLVVELGKMVSEFNQSQINEQNPV